MWVNKTLYNEVSPRLSLDKALTNMNNEKYLFVAFIIFANVSKNRIIVHVHNALKLTNTTWTLTKINKLCECVNFQFMLAKENFSVISIFWVNLELQKDRWDPEHLLIITSRDSLYYMWNDSVHHSPATVLQRLVLMWWVYLHLFITTHDHIILTSDLAESGQTAEERELELRAGDLLLLCSDSWEKTRRSVTL